MIENSADSHRYEEDFFGLLDELISDTDSEKSLQSNSDDSLIRKYKRCKANTKQKRQKIEVRSANGSTMEFEAFFPNPSSVVKYDIRRSYANIMFNVLNSGNFRMFFGFFDEFCVPSFTHRISRTITEKSSPRTIVSTNNGLVNSSKKWQFAMNRTPDAAFRMKNATILTKKDGSESRLVCSFVFEATKLYDDAADPVPDEALYRSSEDSPDTDYNFKGDRTAMLESVSQSVEEYNKTRLVLREKPKHIHAEGVITLWIDRNCMLTKMEMDTQSN